jgi:protein TonB
MALSDYMPYGAPELLEGASPRMARSTFAATGLVAAMVCALGALVSSRPAVREVPAEVFRQFEFQPEIHEPQLQPGLVPVIPKVTPVAREFQPVADERTVVPAIDETPIVGAESSTHRGEPDTAPSGDDPIATPPADPLPGKYVYTDELPTLAHAVKPIYPDIAREAGVEGTVKLQLLVGLDGHVLRALVRRGGSVPMLDEAAIAAALATVFTPALANNRPVKVWVAQDYCFKLH